MMLSKQMMKKFLVPILAFTAVATMIVAFTACQTKEQKRQASVDRANQMTYQRGDSIMSEVFDSDLQRVFEVADSLRDAGELDDAGRDLFYGSAHQLLHQDDEAIACYRRVVSGNNPSDRDVVYYQSAGGNLAALLYHNKHDYQGALEVAMPILKQMEDAGFGVTAVQISLHAMMGECYLQLGDHKNAADAFRFAQDCCTRILQSDSTFQNTLYILSKYEEIVVAYTNAKSFNEALPWGERYDSLFKVIEKRFGHEEDAKEDIEYYRHQGLDLRALMLQALGRDAEAARAYEEAERSEYAQTDLGILNSTDYLMATHRYAEAARKFEVLDKFLLATGIEPNLDAITDYYMPKLRANYHAGRKDSALRVAMQVAEMIDTAYARQKKSQVAELATVYDTQGKERQIAEQQAELSQQRWIGTLVALVLLTVFFTVYTLHRRKAQKRLATAHQQLETAHEKLETAHTELQTAYNQLEATTAAKERIESELRIARDIQMSMVPGVFPEHEGLDMYAEMTTAKEVGGDLYGYVLQGENLYFCVGDVSGKGVPASLFMSQSARLFRTLATEGLTPVDIAVRMNNELAENNDRGMFVTMFIGMLHLNTGRLDYCNCGHNAPVIDGQFLKMAYDNAPLGLWEDDPFYGETIDDIRGRQLLIYTDGLNEAENQQQELLGNKRLLELMADTASLTSRQVIDMLKEAVEEHRAGAEPNDDLTLMCLKLYVEDV